MEEEHGRFGIYVGRDGMLASSICHAQPGNAGRGECNHFSFSSTPEENQRKLNYYLAERVTGRLEPAKIDGTAGDFLSAFRNWLVLERGYNADKLTLPQGDETILDVWFDGDEGAYRRMISLAKRTSLLSSLSIGDDNEETLRDIDDADIGINVISNPTLGDDTDDRVAIDTATWLSMNNINQHAESTRQRDDASVVNVLATGDARVNIHDIERLHGSFVRHGDVNDNIDVGGDIDKVLNDRYIKK